MLLLLALPLLLLEGIVGKLLVSSLAVAFFAAVSDPGGTTAASGGGGGDGIGIGLPSGSSGSSSGPLPAAAVGKAVAVPTPRPRGPPPSPRARSMGDGIERKSRHFDETADEADSDADCQICGSRYASRLDPLAIGAAKADEMPARAQHLFLEEFRPDRPAVAVDGGHMIVATHSGYVVFFRWVDDYPAETVVDLDDDSGDDEDESGNHAQRGYWEESTVFYHAGDNDADATVDISDGIAVVGMPDSHTKYGKYAGLVYVYELNSRTSEWENTGPIYPMYFPERTRPHLSINNQTNHAFGTDVKIQDHLLVVGAPGADRFTGVMYVFKRWDLGEEGNGVHWVQMQQHTPVEVEESCPEGGAIFGGGLQMRSTHDVNRHIIAVGADCMQHWMFVYKYHPYPDEPTLTRLFRVRDEHTLVRKEKDDHNGLMASVVITDRYFVYSLYDRGVYIHEKSNGKPRHEEAHPFELKQFIDARPFGDRGFGGHLLMTEDDSVLIVCGRHHLFFFARGNGTDWWELSSAFPVPRVERGMDISDGLLVMAGREDVYTLNLRDMLASLVVAETSSKPSSWEGMDEDDDEEDDDPIELEVAPDGTILRNDNR